MTFSAMALGVNQTKRQFIAVGGNSPQATAYEFSTGGFGTQWTAGVGNRPGSSTSDSPFFNPSNSALAFMGDNSIAVYPWPPTGANFPTKYTDPATMPSNFGSLRGAKFSPSGKTVVFSNSVYPWSSAGFGTKYTDPVAPDFLGQNATWNPQENVISSCTSSPDFQQTFAWSNATGFGTKYANPATLPLNTTISVDFSPSGNDIAFTTSFTGVKIIVYPWSSGFGTKYANPADLPGDSICVKFSPSGKDIAVAQTDVPRINVYPWSSGFGTKYANPATAIPQGARSVAFSRTGDTICVGHNGSPYISAYIWNSGVGFGTKYTNPASIPSSTVDVTFG